MVLKSIYLPATTITHHYQPLQYHILSQNTVKSCATVVRPSHLEIGIGEEQERQSCPSDCFATVLHYVENTEGLETGK